MQKWEYMIIVVMHRNETTVWKIQDHIVGTMGNAPTVRETLAKLGQEGWEAVCSFGQDASHILLKRPTS